MAQPPATTPEAQTTSPLPEVPPEFLKFTKQDKKKVVPRQQPIPSCEKLIFVAIKTEEQALEWVSLQLGIAFQRCHDPAKRLDYFDLGMVGNDRVLAVRTDMGPLSVTGSAARSIQYLALTGAQTIISVGMAFGTLPIFHSLGDVLVATGVLPYDNKTVRTGINGDPLIDYGDVQVYPSNFEMETRFRRAAEAEQWRGIVQFGLFLSGGARIHCAKFRHELTLGCGSGKGGQVIGGDMEAVGFLSTSDKENPCWIVVKAISDFADHERDTIIKTSRPVACWRAANFVLSALKNG